MHTRVGHHAGIPRDPGPQQLNQVDMMPSRLSSKRPDLMNKDAEHASLKLDLAAETDEKWTLASGDEKHDAGDARAREKPAFASSNHASSTPAAAAGTLENTTLLHASQPLVAIDKSSNFSSAARMVSACQPMQPCPTYSAASNKPALQSGRRPPACQSIPSQIPQQPSVASPPTSPRPASSSRAPASCC